jgi:hypothetical protein
MPAYLKRDLARSEKSPSLKNVDPFDIGVSSSL